MTISFVDLLELETINKTTFRSIADPFVPGKGHEQSPHANTYGGHVYAQAAWAAAQTVSNGFMIHVSYVWADSSATANHLSEYQRLLHLRWEPNNAIRL